MSAPQSASLLLRICSIGVFSASFLTACSAYKVCGEWGVGVRQCDGWGTGSRGVSTLDTGGRREDGEEVASAWLQSQPTCATWRVCHPGCGSGDDGSSLRHPENSKSTTWRLEQCLAHSDGSGNASPSSGSDGGLESTSHLCMSDLRAGCRGGQVTSLLCSCSLVSDVRTETDLLSHCEKQGDDRSERVL